MQAQLAVLTVVFCIMTSCKVVGEYPHFVRKYCPHIQGENMVAVCPFDTTVTTHHTIWCQPTRPHVSPTTVKTSTSLGNHCLQAFVNQARSCCFTPQYTATFSSTHSITTIRKIYTYCEVRCISHGST